MFQIVVRPWRVLGCVRMRSVSLSSSTIRARSCLGLSPIFKPFVLCMALPTFSPSAPAESWAVKGKVGDSAMCGSGASETLSWVLETSSHKGGRGSKPQWRRIRSRHAEWV
eukprot:2758385-Amphidinium_carterae.1